MRWLEQNKVDYVLLKYSPPNASLSFSDCPNSPLCEWVHIQKICKKSGTIPIFASSELDASKNPQQLVFDSIARRKAGN